MRRLVLTCDRCSKDMGEPERAALIQVMRHPTRDDACNSAVPLDLCAKCAADVIGFSDPAIDLITVPR